MDPNVCHRIHDDYERMVKYIMPNVTKSAVVKLRYCRIFRQVCYIAYNNMRPRDGFNIVTKYELPEQKVTPAPLTMVTGPGVQDKIPYSTLVCLQEEKHLNDELVNMGLR